MLERHRRYTYISEIKFSMLEIKNTLLGIHIGLDIIEKTTHEFEDAIKAIQKETMKI